MPSFRQVLTALLIASTLILGIAEAQQINLQPKYGLAQKNAAQLAADEAFIKTIDAHYKSDRKKAANDISMRGWQYLKAGNHDDAMRRFNQAWLLDNACGFALWGMGALQNIKGMHQESLKLIAEAEQYVGANIDFQADHAWAVGTAGVSLHDQVLLNNAFSRFGEVHRKAPQHTKNLENWAMTLFLIGDYAGAWEKIKLAEATPRGSGLNQKFIDALQQKMPRP